MYWKPLLKSLHVDRHIPKKNNHMRIGSGSSYFNKMWVVEEFLVFPSSPMVQLSLFWVNDEYISKFWNNCKYKRRQLWIMILNVTMNNVSFILWLSFVGGGNQKTRWKPQTLRRSLTNLNHIKLCLIAEKQVITLVMIGYYCIGGSNSLTIMRSQPQWSTENWGRRDRMVVGFTTTCTCAISAYQNLWVRTSFMVRCTWYKIMW
jgi:hypothetical protein